MRVLCILFANECFNVYAVQHAIKKLTVGDPGKRNQWAKGTTPLFYVTYLLFHMWLCLYCYVITLRVNNGKEEVCHGVGLNADEFSRNRRVCL